MARRTIRWRTRISIGVAGDAIRGKVCARERKITFIMVETILCVSRRVAGEAGRTFIDIPRNAVMPSIRFGVQVADRTTKFRII